jgi:hypothetical protein
MQTHLMQSINGREPLDGQICTVTASHMRAVADLGFSGGGMVWGTRGRVREYPPLAGGPWAWPPGKFFANRRRKYAFSRSCLGSICLFHHFIV